MSCLFASDSVSSSPSSIESFAETPATPCSTSSGSKSGASGSHHGLQSTEASDFLSDLHNYVALGCITLEDLTDCDNVSDSGGWQAIHQLPLYNCFDTSLYSHLAKLLEAGWIRVQTGRSVRDRRYIIHRVFVLPGDAGHRFVDRTNKKLWVALECLLADIDVSPQTWQGDYTPQCSQKFDPWATADSGSLFYMFNKLPSPSPDPNSLREKYTHEALEDLLDPESAIPGLKTSLYPYQRRSAGLMLQRESVTALQLDPRLEKRIAPDGSTFFYGPRDLLFLREPRYYEGCRGGILAETMGLGKTLIVLSLILATKDHPPNVPTPYNLPVVRPQVARLSTMVVSAINRKSIPWKVEFERLRHARNDMSIYANILENSPPSYEVPMEPQRWNRKTVLPPPKQMILASTTLIVVPRNLCRQWQSELQKHIEPDALRVLVMEDLRRALPLPNELRTYDIVLFSRNRFEMEIRDGSDEQGRRMLATQLACRCPYIGSTRTRDCTCVRTDDLYDSPLKHLHFKRLIIDEGHFFSNNNTTAVSVANKLVKADHRWIVSGTPAKDLLGVEVDMSAVDNMWQIPRTISSRDLILQQRYKFSSTEDTAGAIRSLGSLASNFLKIRPWCAARVGERKAEWDEYIYRHEDLRRRTYSGFSTCLRRFLEAVVVKTLPEDVERDIELPPLVHEVVRLEPSFYDKLTANLFTLVLTANAITSERTDADYLFHKNSAKARYQLISNLRQSAFFWTGFSETDICASIQNSTCYLAKNGTACSEEDRQLLTDTLSHANTILASEGWKAMSRSHEIGLFIDDWPVESAQYWSFDQGVRPLMTGASQLLYAQRYVNERAGNIDPGEGLAGAGIKALAPARYGPVERGGVNKRAEKPVLTNGIPTSSLDGEPILRKRSSGTKISKTSRSKSNGSSIVIESTRKRAMRKAPSTKTDRQNVTEHDRVNVPPSSADSKKRRYSEMDRFDFDPESCYLRSRIVGTTSAKLSYLASQILKHYQDEKILVFYDGDNIAYYIAQMLELLQIKHEIYAKSLAAHLKSEYVVRFDQETQDRVLLMDVKHAAFGLNISSASRIYFVNPVCRPNIEAQAIKRAHRIGQTRKVYVETLVLKGTIEEKMLERAKRMTRMEHRDAKALEDDGGIRQIIQSARALPVYENEKTGYGQMAPLEKPQQLWGREPDWREAIGVAPVVRHATRKKKTLHDLGDGDEEMPIVQSDVDSERYRKRRVLAFMDCTNANDEDIEVDGDSESEPIIDRWKDSLQSLREGVNKAAVKKLKPQMLRTEHDLPLPSMKSEVLAPQMSPLASPITPQAGIQETESKVNEDQSFPIGPVLSWTKANWRDEADLVQKIIQRL